MFAIGDIVRLKGSNVQGDVVEDVHVSGSIKVQNIWFPARSFELVKKGINYLFQFGEMVGVHKFHKRFCASYTYPIIEQRHINGQNEYRIGGISDKGKSMSQHWFPEKELFLAPKTTTSVVNVTETKTKETCTHPNGFKEYVGLTKRDRFCELCKTTKEW